MLSREELIELSNPDDTKFTQEEWMGKLSVISRGHPYYGLLKKEFPTHWMSFSGMHKRKKEYNIEIDSLFERNTNGFIEFILYLGDVPENMIIPTVGRIDHSKGYIVGNFRWESKGSNSSEVGIRNVKKYGWEQIRLSSIRDRRLSSEIVRVIKNTRVGQLKHLPREVFIKDCIEWIKKQFNISIGRTAIRYILDNKRYKDVV